MSAHRPRPPFPQRAAALAREVRRDLAEVRKFTVSVVGLAALAAASGTLTGTAETVCVAVVSVGTAIGVYTVPNKARGEGR